MSAAVKILVTGANGQLGREIYAIAPLYDGFDFVFTNIKELDITDPLKIDNFLSGKDFSHIINCAAYTAVDKAESEPEKANLINVFAVKNLTEAATRYNTRLIHISTDYIFAGNSTVPYKEDDATAPQSVYGKTKLDGENIIRQSEVDALIIRTSWLYSRFGNNFVHTMMKYGRERDELKVVCDQTGTPTYAGDLARTILLIAGTEKKYGNEIYHYSNEGSCSWYDFAVEIMKLSGIDCKIVPITTKDYPTAAKRPLSSLLDKTKIRETFGLNIPHWEKSLAIYISSSLI